MKKNKSKKWDKAIEDIENDYLPVPGFEPKQREDDNELITYLLINKKQGIISSIQARDGDDACYIFNKIDPIDREDWTIAVELGDQPTRKDYH
jgi:hypothetical protein